LKNLALYSEAKRDFLARKMILG